MLMRHAPEDKIGQEVIVRAAAVLGANVGSRRPGIWGERVYTRIGKVGVMISPELEERWRPWA